MDDDIYLMRCVNSTATLTDGNYYRVVDYKSGSDSMIVINDFGNKVRVQKFRFTDLKIEKMKKNQKIVCTNPGKFRNIKKGKTYEVVEDDGNYYIIKNDRGLLSRYSHKYFQVEAIEEKPKKPAGYICVIPSEKLTYRKRYRLNKIDDKYVEVINDEGESVKVLAKRFKL